MADQAFYLPDGDNRFISTDWTTGPWGNGLQHGGPPAALMARVAVANGRPAMQVARATFEIMRPIPVAPLVIGSLVVRPGKKVELIHATMSAEGQQVMDASIWRVRVTELEDFPETPNQPVPSRPEDGTKVDLFPGGEQSYLTGMQWSFTAGEFLKPGPATAWARMQIPLVAGEEIEPLTRALILADSGNGISAELDFEKWLFINSDLSVYLHRLPAGEWVCLEAATEMERNGIGVASSTLYDEKGSIGKGQQILFVDRRD